MLLVPEDLITKLISVKDTLRVIVSTYKDYSDKLVHVPSRITLNVRADNDSAIVLAAIFDSKPYYGLKEASSFPSNVNKNVSTVISNIQVYSADTGELLSIIGANHLTGLKTGAASAVATDYLAGKEEDVLAIIGTGVQAQNQLAAIQEVRNLEKVHVYDIDKNRAEQFSSLVEEIKNRKYEVIVADNAEQCVSNAGIVVTVTTSSKPVLKGSWLRKGAHVNAVGSFTPEMQEIDSDAVFKAGKIVCDNIDEVWQVAGDLIVPKEEGKIDNKNLYGELGDIVSGKLPGREEDEITIYESVGFAPLDIALAIEIYEKALASGDGENIDF